MEIERSGGREKEKQSWEGNEQEKRPEKLVLKYESFVRVHANTRSLSQQGRENEAREKESSE